MLSLNSAVALRCSTTGLAVVLLFSTTANAVVDERNCPINPTQFQVDIPDPDPGSEPGAFPANLDDILDFVRANNITSVKQLLDHSPSHLRKNYIFVERTRGLGQTSVDEPGLMLFGSDGRFMMNMDTQPTSPRYEVVDLGYLDEAGDWEFKSLDFRTLPATLSPNGGNDGECRACHGQGGANSNGPMRPFWGNYLEWHGIFSDSGQHSVAVSPNQIPALSRIEDGTQNPDRFHSIEIPTQFYRRGGNIRLADRSYGNSLTVANNEIGSAVAESIFKRAKRSPRYEGLREEFLATAYCGKVDSLSRGPGDSATVSPQYRTELMDYISRQGGSTAGLESRISNGWLDVVKLWGLDPLHEFSVHKLTSEYNESDLFRDTSWSASSGSLHHQLSMLVLLDLAEDNSQVDALLRNNQTSYEMTACGIHFDNLKGYLQHKVYANYTLKGNARQLARSSYYDISYTRFHQALNNVKVELCGLLTSEVGDNDSNPDPVLPITPPVIPVTPANPSSAVNDACAQGETPLSGGRLTAGKTVCLVDTDGAKQRQMGLLVDSEHAGGTIEVVLSHGSGNADLLHRYKRRPNREQYDQISASSGNDEKLIISNVSPGWHYIHVRANPEFSGVALRATYQ